MFAIQFLNTGEVWLMAKPEDFTSVAQYIDTGICEVKESIEVEDIKLKVKNKISSSESARKAFNEERNKRFDKTKSAK